ncbi:MAG: carbohydrate ABC transporter permease [Spirochaetaceae bacterium]
MNNTIKYNPTLKIIIYLVLIVFSTLAIGPIIFSFFTSFRTNPDFVANTLALPKSAYFENYKFMIFDAKIYRYFVNNLIIGIGGLSIYIFVSTSAAFAFGILRFTARRAIFLLVLFLMIFPQMVIAIPLFKICLKLGIYNTRLGLILAWAAYIAPFGTYMLTTYFSTIPRAIYESAQIDGAKIYTVLFRIMMPIAKPMITTLAIMGFLGLWNEFTFALLLLQTPKLRTVSLGIAMLAGEYGLSVPRLSAGIMISSLVPLGVFLIFQNRVAFGASAGSVKG